MTKPFSGGRTTLAALLFTAAAGAALVLPEDMRTAKADSPPPASPAVPVSVATVARRDIPTWSDFSGRLEAVDQVDVRPRVAGAIVAVHFREGSLVKKGDALFSIDPAPYAAELARAKAQVAAAQAALSLARNEFDRGQKLFDQKNLSERDLDQRVNGRLAAEANLQAAQASQSIAELDLDYTTVRAPVAGRVGRIEVTVGNLVAAGSTSPALASLVSVSPIYATFNADESVVARALATLPADDDGHGVEAIPVRMTTAAAEASVTGHVQLIDNKVDAASGTVKVRAVFDNPGGRLIPGQFARLRLGQAKAQAGLAITERAVGTDQDKRFVLVVDAANKVVYREVKLGEASEDLRVVTSGLSEGERIIVNGLQRVRPGAVVAPQAVSMTGAADGAQAAAETNTVKQ